MKKLDAIRRILSEDSIPEAEKLFVIRQFTSADEETIDRTVAHLCPQKPKIPEPPAPEKSDDAEFQRGYKAGYQDGKDERTLREMRTTPV